MGGEGLQHRIEGRIEKIESSSFNQKIFFYTLYAISI